MDDEEDERREDHEGQVGVARALSDLVGPEAVDQAADKRGQPPLSEARDEEVTGCGRCGEGERDQGVEGGDRAPEDGDRRQQSSEEQRAGVVEQVDAERVVGKVREQRIVAVAHRIDGPPEEPHGAELVPTELRDARRMRAPDVPEDTDGESDIDEDGDHCGEDSVTTGPPAFGDRPDFMGGRRSPGRRLVRRLASSRWRIRSHGIDPLLGRDRCLGHGSPSIGFRVFHPRDGRKVDARHVTRHGGALGDGTLERRDPVPS